MSDVQTLSSINKGVQTSPLPSTSWIRAFRFHVCVSPFQTRHSDALTIVQTLRAYFDHMVYFSCRTLYLVAYEFVHDGC